MPTPLKLFFSHDRIRLLAQELVAVWPAFPADRFYDAASPGLDQLELMDRAAAITTALRQCLPQDFPAAAALLVRAAGPPLGHVDGNGMGPFHYLPHVRFIGAYGLDHFEPSMAALHALTKRFTAEFAIRPFLETHETKTLARLSAWVTDPDPHVRRLVSEGTRPRLPWASRLRSFQQDPTPTLALLDRLKDDPALYVRRSVANHLNDIGKDHPELALQVCEQWAVGASDERRWILTHALRTAIKRGDPRALAVRGFAGDGLTVTGSVPSTAQIGHNLPVQVRVHNPTDQEAAGVVDIVIHFVRANGTTRPKVFKGRDVRLPAGGELTFGKSISLADLSTRTHHPGAHAVDVQINGITHHVGVVQVGATERSG